MTETQTKTYYGTKKVEAWPESRREPHTDDYKKGYAVKYEDGYTSWSPKDAFEAAYEPVDAMSFSGALKALKDGHRVARAGWNGKGMFLYFVPGSTFKVNRPPLLGIYPEDTEISYHGHVDMKTAQGECVPWVCSQTDMLANDWMIVEA